MPSPVYQWRKAFLLNMAVNCSEILLKSSWMAVELPMKVAAILRPLGGMSQTAVLTLLGIHSTKHEEFLFWMLSICSSTSFMDLVVGGGCWWLVAVGGGWWWRWWWLVVDGGWWW